MNKEPYYIGLDIGTNSVGWAVTDEQYRLRKFKKKDMWGIRLFENAQTAEERRMYRNSRRRLQRQHKRIDLLQDLFADEINKVDETFFIRLNESRLHFEDKTTEFKHPLFSDTDYTDIDYYKEYPTIYHLRKALIDNTKQKYDARLVYLALHHIIKNRGHFLIDGDIQASKSFEKTFESFLADTSGESGNVGFQFEINDVKAFDDILRDRKKAKSERERYLAALFTIDEDGIDKDQINARRNVIKQICKLIVGNKGDFKKIFPTDLADEEKTSFKFSDTASEEFRNNIDAAYPEIAAVYDAIKRLHDWSVLVEILADEEYISFAKVAEYNTHKENLAELRRIILKYCDKKTYNEFFNSEKVSYGYTNYIGAVKKNGKLYKNVKMCSEEDFYNNLKKLLGLIKEKIESTDQATFDKIMLGVEMANLLPKQRSKDNSTVPRQIHETELVAILENAKHYLQFLNDVDADGVSVCEKIVGIFEFRVPYYVGPLSDRHKDSGSNSWIVRKEEGKIYPWNFNEKVDVEASNEQFIRRMTNKCTYIVGADVIPKNSIMYSKYMVLNELNNLRIRGNKTEPELKQKIFNELFLTHSRVTGKTLLTYLQQHCDAGLKAEDLSGFDKDFKSNMNPYLDFEKKIFGRPLTADDIAFAEDVIRWITIYDDDPKMIRSIVQKNYPGKLDDVQLKQLSKLKYSGWGNFSKEFLNGIEGTDADTGEVFTIMQALWSTNNNLMQLLSAAFTFSDEIRKYNEKNSEEIASVSYETLVKDLYVSPANKRAVWQTLQIVKEIVSVIGYEPDKFFVEMARGDEEKGDKGRTVSRKRKLVDLYAACEDDTREWIKEIESKDERAFNSKKLYLYYTQMGRCMYTGEVIDLDDLMQNNSKWDIDHIYPQSRIIDDSLDNQVLVRKTANAKKSNEVISPKIQKQMMPLWSQLKKQGFISQKKFDRLTKKGDFTTEELAGFIERQLVETRQSSKAVAELLNRIYDSSRVVYVKANLVSRFRKNELKELKSRRVNDYHHAKDAYLNIVVGNVYDAKFTSNPRKWIKENRDSNYSLNRVFYYTVVSGGKTAWEAPERVEGTNLYSKTEKGGLKGGSIDLVRTTMQQNNILYTEYSYCGKGQLFDEQPKSNKEGARIPLKAGLDPEKYGGYKSPNTAYFCLIEFDGKNGERSKQITAVPVYIANILDKNPSAIKEYCEKERGMVNVVVLRDKIKKNSLLSIDGFPMRIRGESGTGGVNLAFKNNLQLIVDSDSEEIIRKIEKYLDKEKNNEAIAEFDGFCSADLIALYDLFIEKLNTIYKKRPSNQGDNLYSWRNRFIELESLTQKAIIVDNILTMLRCDISTSIDLKNIGGSSNAGLMAKNKNTVGQSNVVLINQSVTGLFENRIEL